MSENTIFFALISIAFLIVGVLAWLLNLEFRMQKVEETCELKRNAIEVLDSIAKNLTDPIKIEAEMEAAATAREMRDANRKYVPRDTAGPPARVHRPPKLRSVPKKR